jgi:hypothetical protein
LYSRGKTQHFSLHLCTVASKRGCRMYIHKRVGGGRWLWHFSFCGAFSLVSYKLITGKFH